MTNPFLHLNPRVFAITSAFERDADGRLVLDLGDGRGYTCDCSRNLAFGFTTADEEVVAVVEEYTRLVGSNHLSGPIYIELLRLKIMGSDDASKLAALEFSMHWRNAMGTPAGVQAYTTVADRIYGEPARAYCAQLGLTSNIAYSILFDALVQHGNGDDPDGVPAMIERVRKDGWAFPSEAVEKGCPSWLVQGLEEEFLSEFLSIRKQTLLHPANRDTAAAWRESTPRVEVLRHLLATNPTLEGEIHLLGGGDEGYDEVLKL